MTIDERLDRLTKRHEALTQSVELLTADLRESARTDAQIRQLGERMDQIEIQIRELSERMDQTDGLIRQLGEHLGQTDRQIRALAGNQGRMMDASARLGNIAAVHEERIDRIEGDE